MILYFSRINPHKCGKLKKEDTQNYILCKILKKAIIAGGPRLKIFLVVMEKKEDFKKVSKFMVEKTKIVLTQIAAEK